MLDVALLVLLIAGLWFALQRSHVVTQRYGPHAAATGLWLFAWTSLVLSGLILTTRDAFPSLSHAEPLLRACFAWSMLGGAWCVAGARIPRWIFPMGASLGFLGASCSWLGWGGTAGWVGFGSVVPPLLVAAVRLGRGPAPHTLWSRSLAPLFVAMAGVMAAPMLVSGWRSDSPPVLALALVFAPALFAAQLRAVADANRERLRRERDVLERRFSARTEELAAANRSLRREVDLHQATEDALRASEQRHRLVSELSSDFSFETHVDRERGLETEWVSGAFERLTGRPPEALAGWGFVSLLAPDQQDETRALISEFEGRGRTAEFEREIETPSGERRHLNIRVLSMEEAGGGLRVVGGARDVTEARRAQQLRFDLEHQLQESQRLESLGVLTGGIAHDFNNLLSVILGNLRLATGATPEAASAHARLEKVRAAAEYAAELTEQMLAYSGKASITKVATDFGLLAREMEALLAAALPERARLELDIGSGCVVDGDATRLRQVLLNLVANAGESLSDGRGRVTVRIGSDEGVPDDVRGWFGDVPEAPSVVLEVSDDGCGMDAELQRRIFDPFFTTKFSGRGLGLASVLGIVRSHGGAIRADSKPEQGTSLLVRLPRSSGTPAELAPVARAESSCGHVLLIDDEESVLELAAEFLVRSGHTVETAIGGHAGVECFRASPDEIDVVVLDLGMPDLDGGEVFEELRRIRPDVRVVLSTGYREEQAARRFEASGVAAFLGKPYEPEQLVDAVARARAAREV
ncbi:MAG: ATP-binding protein [Myxococcota bacterium]